MNKINPHGYNKGYGFVVVGIIFAIWSGILISVALANGGDIAEIAPFLFFAVLFCLILIIYNLVNNFAASKKIKHMDQMRQCEKICGEIVEFSVRPVILGRELKPEKVKMNEVGNPNYRARDLGYRVIVNYEHPLTGEKKQAVSELYLWIQLHQYEKSKSGKLFGDIKKCVREDIADVYVAEDGSTWVDVVKADRQ